MGNKPDSQMKIDPDGKRLQIDDLIIIPSNLHSPPEGRTALQSLAAIASKYQGASQPQDSSSPKKARYEDKMAGQPIPATSPGSSLGLKPGDLGASFGLTALQQQSLFAALNPALIAGTWPAGLSLPGSKTSTRLAFGVLKCHLLKLSLLFIFKISAPRCPTRGPARP
jgi:hypothetical protein